MEDVKKELLKNGETLEELDEGVYVLQREGAYHFTSDSLLLAYYTKMSPKSIAADLCSGSGVVGILAAHLNKVKSMTLIELQPDLAEMCERSVKINGGENVSVLNADVKDAYKLLGRERFDAVCCNPPYYRVGEGKTREDEGVALCRHELRLTLEEMVKRVSEILKFGGRFYVVYRADRLSELLVALSKYKLETKDMVLVKPCEGKEIDTVLVCAKKGAEKGVRVRCYLREELEKDRSILTRK